VRARRHIPVVCSLAPAALSCIILATLRLHYSYSIPFPFFRVKDSKLSKRNGTPVGPKIYIITVLLIRIFVEHPGNKCSFTLYVPSSSGSFVLS